MGTSQIHWCDHPSGNRAAATADGTQIRTTRSCRNRATTSAAEPRSGTAAAIQRAESDVTARESTQDRTKGLIRDGGDTADPKGMATDPSPVRAAASYSCPSAAQPGEDTNTRRSPR